MSRYWAMRTPGFHKQRKNHLRNTGRLVMHPCQELLNELMNLLLTEFLTWSCKTWKQLHFVRSKTLFGVEKTQTYIGNGANCGKCDELAFSAAVYGFSQKYHQFQDLSNINRAQNFHIDLNKLWFFCRWSWNHGPRVF